MNTSLWKIEKVVRQNSNNSAKGLQSPEPVINQQGTSDKQHLRNCCGRRWSANGECKTGISLNFLPFFQVVNLQKRSSRDKRILSAESGGYVRRESGRGEDQNRVSLSTKFKGSADGVESRVIATIGFVRVPSKDGETFYKLVPLVQPHI